MIKKTRKTDSFSISFIICVNDENEYVECQKYIEHLYIPKGYKKDIIAIRNASSMAAGYNMGMRKSNAKYKVYLHQDVYIINPNFINNMLEVFEKNSKIGMLGCIGTNNLDEHALAISDWNIGRVYCNGAYKILNLQQTPFYCKVEALDGLLLATQYDLQWREDIFDGWDFYDISQCMEFIRSEYEIVVPYQDNIWCYHDNQPCKMKQYDKYREKFCKEYQDIKNFTMKPLDYNIDAYEKTLNKIIVILKELIDKGEKKEVSYFFERQGDKKYMELQELELISNIDRLEKQQESQLQLWQEGLSTNELCEKIRCLKRLLKRIEYGLDNVTAVEEITAKYSVFAIAFVCSIYVEQISKVTDKISNYFIQQNMQFESYYWNLLKIQF